MCSSTLVTTGGCTSGSDVAFCWSIGAAGGCSCDIGCTACRGAGVGGGEGAAGATAASTGGVEVCTGWFVGPEALSGTNCRPTASDNEVTKVIAPAVSAVTAPV